MNQRSAPARTTARVAGILAALVVLVPIAAAAAPIEDFAPYRPQTKCSPTAKAGTLELARWLMREYPGTGSLGISRACSHGGVSEHKEGRAFDWALNHSSARDRRYARNFLSRIFRTDKYGHRAALARRMGIMYLIWNDRIYSSYRKFEPRNYLSSACSSKKKCSVTLRHRNHIHISLSRAGGAGSTSWYHRDDAAPSPKPRPTPTPAPTPEPENTLDLGRKPYAKVVVPPDGETVTTRFSLREGATYKLTAAGLFGYGGPHQVADASCAWSRTDNAWGERPDERTAERHGSLNLLVNRKPVFATECRGNHRYSVTFTPGKTGPLTLRVSNTDRAEVASGRLVLTVSKKSTDVSAALPAYPTLTPAPRRTSSAPRGYGLLAESLEVPAVRAKGVTTTQELRQGAEYRITVSGVVDLGRGMQSDGQCVFVGDRWYRQASLDRRTPGADHGNLYLDGLPFEGRGSGCDGHRYVTDYTAPRTGKLRLALWDPLGNEGNTGALNVTVQRLTAIPSPAPGRTEEPRKAPEWRQDRDWLQVDASRAWGTVSTMRVRKGQRVQVVVRGVQRSHGLTADASCVGTSEGWLPRDPSLALPQDPLSMWVDGQEVAWRSVGEGDVCSREHLYTATVTATKSGPLRLAVLDVDHRDNTGVFKVTLLRQG